MGYLLLPNPTLCLFFSLLLLTQWHILASASLKAYVVYFGEHVHAKDSSGVDRERVKETHFSFLESFLGSRESAREALFYSYARHINGFAATLDEDVAAQIAKHPDVVSIFLSKGRKLHTTRSWIFMGLERNGMVPSSSIWKKARFGEDTIIGNLDTGVWPESKSFDDEGLGPIPSKWNGTCQVGSDPTFRCNRKLIGARFFNKGWASSMGTPPNATYNSPRDADGHGTHTLSTAGGSFAPGASVFGFGNGTAKGGSPRARVAAYKVCYPPVNGSECFDADILAAFDAAIGDGVGVLSVSLGGEPTPYFNDGVAIGSFHAVRAGIVVVCSAGNSGPGDGTVTNVSPWEITVGASTMDREFPSFVVLGNNESFKGQSLSQKTLLPQELYPVISAADAKLANASTQDALLCSPGTLDPVKAKGKILVCLRGITARVDKGEQAALVGAVGMILANNADTGNEILADAHVLPASHVNYFSGVSIFSYINSTRSPVAYITQPTTRIATKPAPFMAAFSSKGPNPITPEILKPDITAPGVSVIAAYTQAASPTNEDFDTRRVLFNSVSGTSMSCPHVAGIVGLLKTLHPSWSPAAIRSAIMTTATTMDNDMETILNASSYTATPFSYGAGHVRPNNAMDPGLVYDLTVDDYLDFLCALNYNSTQISTISNSTYQCPLKPISLTNFNYPSITLPNFTGSVTVSRTVKNVGSRSTYRAFLRSPTGTEVAVHPNKLKFKEVGEEKSFRVTLQGNKSEATNGYVFGDLIWSDGRHHVRSPIVVKW